MTSCLQCQPHLNCSKGRTVCNLCVIACSLIPDTLKLRLASSILLLDVHRFHQSILALIPACTCCILVQYEFLTDNFSFLELLPVLVVVLLVVQQGWFQPSLVEVHLVYIINHYETLNMFQ